MCEPSVVRNTYCSNFMKWECAVEVCMGSVQWEYVVGVHHFVGID